MSDEKKDADLSCRIPGDLKDRLGKLKSAYQRSEGWLVIECLRAHLPALESGAFAVRDAPGPLAPAKPASKYPDIRKPRKT